MDLDAIYMLRNEETYAYNKILWHYTIHDPYTETTIITDGEGQQNVTMPEGRPTTVNICNFCGNLQDLSVKHEIINIQTTKELTLANEVLYQVEGIDLWGTKKILLQGTSEFEETSSTTLEQKIEMLDANFRAVVSASPVMIDSGKIKQKVTYQDVTEDLELVVEATELEILRG